MLYLFIILLFYLILYFVWFCLINFLFVFSCVLFNFQYLSPKFWNISGAYFKAQQKNPNKFGHSSRSGSSFDQQEPEPSLTWDRKSSSHNLNASQSSLTSRTSSLGKFLLLIIFLAGQLGREKLFKFFCLILLFLLIISIHFSLLNLIL